jgi:hypothetical protein
LGDPLVSAKAASSRDELKASIEHANKVNQGLLEKYAVNSDREGEGGESAVMMDIEEVEDAEYSMREHS